MEINSIDELWLYALCGLFFVVAIAYSLNRYGTNKRLKINYPLLNQQQRWFMHDTVERCDEIILDALRKKYADKKGVISRDIKVIQRGTHKLVIHIYYRIPICSEPLTVIFNFQQPNMFTYHEKSYNIALTEKSNIPIILL